MASSYPPPIVYQLPKSPSSKRSSKLEGLFSGTKLRGSGSAAQPTAHGGFAQLKNVSDSTLASNFTAHDTETRSKDAWQK
ncbi:hypothetical protein G7054_g6826 [Neopestalotiopsis clavispora]|nr:hypothetical protein G7054_g6826 [Neopestalotiopsis clavispora]